MADNSPDDLVVIRSFPSSPFAALAQSALEAAGVESMLKGDDVSGLRPHMLLTRGIRLLVRREDVERALEILDNPARPA